MCLEEGETEVNKCYVLDTRYGLGIANNDLETVQAAFTTASGGDSFKPTALLYFSSKLLRADSRGYTLRHDATITSDSLIDTTNVPSNWATKSIVWDFKTVATSFGSTLRRKFVPRVTLSAENDTDITLQINSINDIGRRVSSIKPIRFRKNWIWGDPTKVWGEDNQVWEFSGVIEEQRRFPSDSLRCSYKQIQLTNAFDIIVTSDDLTTGVIDSTAKTVTLDDIVTYDWPEDSKGQFIYFEVDNYLRGYEILARTADVITYSDPTNLSTPGLAQKWTIRGNAKNEVLNLISLALWYAYLGEPTDYAASSAGSTPA